MDNKPNLQSNDYYSKKRNRTIDFTIGFLATFIGIGMWFAFITGLTSPLTAILTPIILILIIYFLSSRGKREYILKGVKRAFVVFASIVILLFALVLGACSIGTH